MMAPSSLLGITTDTGDTYPATKRTKLKPKKTIFISRFLPLLAIICTHFMYCIFYTYTLLTLPSLC